MPEQPIVIDCPTCSVRVSAKPVGSVYLGDGGFPEAGVFLLRCPSCSVPLLGRAQLILEPDNNQAWDNAERLWPSPGRTELSNAIPLAAREDIKDAQKCLTHGIYSAAAVLCGRSLERMTKDKTGEKTIARGLQKMLEDQLIEKRLFEWAEALRKERNIGAHASDEVITKQNAEDILDFTIAIYDYVYVLHDKFQKYMERKKPTLLPSELT